MGKDTFLSMCGGWAIRNYALHGISLKCCDSVRMSPGSWFLLLLDSCSGLKNRLYSLACLSLLCRVSACFHLTGTQLVLLTLKGRGLVKRVPTCSLLCSVHHMLYIAGQWLYRNPASNRSAEIWATQNTMPCFHLGFEDSTSSPHQCIRKATPQPPAILPH